MCLSHTVTEDQFLLLQARQFRLDLNQPRRLMLNRGLVPGDRFAPGRSATLDFAQRVVEFR